MPTSFVHPDIPSGYDDRLIHNVDIVPIILDLLDLERPPTDGYNSLDQRRELGYNHYENIFYTTGLDRFQRIVRSVWDNQGGRVRHEGSRVETSIISLGLLLKSIHGKQIRSSGNLIDAYKRFTGSPVYGSPQFTTTEFETVLEEIDSSKDETAGQRELSEEEIENLKDLGYI